MRAGAEALSIFPVSKESPMSGGPSEASRTTLGLLSCGAGALREREPPRGFKCAEQPTRGKRRGGSTHSPPRARR